MALNKQNNVSKFDHEPSVEETLDQELSIQGNKSQEKSEIKDEIFTSAESTKNDLQNLETVNSNMKNQLLQMCELENSYINRHGSNPSYLRGLKNISVKPFQVPEVTIAFLSSVSGGKSSFLNTAICNYPISPVAKTTTSICAVETRRVYSYSDERIEVFLLNDDKKSPQSTPIQTFTKQVMNSEIFNKLFDYAKKVVQKDILNVSDTLNYFKDENDKILMNPSNWRHCMVLLMILIDTYVYQDRQLDSNIDIEEEYQEAFNELIIKFQDVNDMRNELLQKIGIPINKDYMIRLYWNSEHIPPNAVLVDLPGTGSATVTTTEQIGHSELVNNYIQSASSILCFFDSKVTFDADTKQILRTFVQSNKLKDFASSTRLTFILHKADTYTPPDTDKQIHQAINSFRMSFSEMNNYPIYAVSSWDGEWELQGSDIPIRNLHHASTFIRNYQQFLHSLPPKEKITENQKQCFMKKYPYQISSNADFKMMDFASFRDKLVTDYIQQIHFLLFIEYFCQQMINLQYIIATVEAERNLYNIAKDCGEDLSEAIVKAMKNALKSAQNDLNANFSALNTRMRDEMERTNGRIKSISNIFMKDYANLNDYINELLQAKINSLERNDDNDIPIAGSLVGGNPRGKSNRTKLLALSEKVAKINFNSYFNKSFNALQQEFELERNIYNTFLTQMIDNIRQFPSEVTDKMDIALKRALEEKGLKDVEGFEQALDTSKDLTKSLLQASCEGYVNALKSDKKIYQTMDNTTKRIDSSLNQILSPYTSGDYAKRALDQFEEFNFFAANIINEKRLEEVLTQFFITDFQNKMQDSLIEALTGKLNTTDSHSNRMINALNSLKKEYLSNEGLKQLSIQVSSACTVTEEIIKNPIYLKGWNEALNNAHKDLDQFFGKGTLTAAFEKIFNAGSNLDWASESIATAKGMLKSAKEAKEDVK